MTKAVLMGVLALAVMGLAACGGGYGKPAATPAVTPAATPTAGKGAAVSINNFAFQPATLSVDKGATVTWTNKDSVPHTVTGEGFDSGSLSQGQTFARSFDKPGTYSYRCAIHPYMKGEVTVK